MHHAANARPETDRPGDEKSTTQFDCTSTPLDRLTDDFTTGYGWGYVAGIERGRQQAEDEIATAQREAARVVHGMATINPWPEQVERAERARATERQRFLDGLRKGAA